MSGSLSNHANFVLDAFAFTPVTVYQPEDIRLGVYTFLPWSRTGLSSIVQNPGPGEVRATVSVSVDVEDDKGGATPVSKTLTLRGPGDVLGLKAGQIIRRFPAPNAPDAQDTFLAYVEFDRPELPWLFTPFAPTGANQERLPPWLALVVLEARHARFESPPATDPPLPLPLRVRTRMGELQPLERSWAFAHAQVMGDVGGVDQVSVRADGAPGVGTDNAAPSVRDRLSDDHAPQNLSRLLCPRRLDDGVNYVACIVPAFDVGVRTALGLPGGTLDPAWTRAAGDDDQEIVLPVYDHWRFTTAPGGDFEELARRLVPVPAPWKVGRRFIDTHLPRGGVSELGPDDPGRVQVLKCALFSAAAPPSGSPPDEGWSMEKREELRDEIDAADQSALRFRGNSTPDLPRVGPRLYARFQRAQNRVGPIAGSDWFDQLNTTPAHRIVAGLGTRVVRKDQEALMQAAWAQVGEIDRANAALVRAQYARYLGASLHTRYLARMSFTAVAQVTRAVQGKLRLGGAGLTVRGQLEGSFVAPTAADLPFRRAFRPRGALNRFTQESTPEAILDQALAPDGSFRDFREPYVQPDGVSGLREETLNALPKKLVADVLGVSERRALGTLRSRMETLGSEAPLADLMTTPVHTWNVGPGKLDPGELGGIRVLETLQNALPRRLKDDTGRSEAIGSLIKGLADSDIPSVKDPAVALETRIRKALPKLKGLPERERPVVGPTIHPRIGRLPIRGGVLRRGRPPRPGIGGLEEPNSALRRPVADAAEPLVTPEAVALAMELKRLRATPKTALATELSLVATQTGIFDLPQLPEVSAPALDRETLLAELHPSVTVTRFAQGRLQLKPGWLPGNWFQNGMVQPVMAAPEFKRPMYEALDAYDRDWLVPGLGLIEQTDFVTLLQTNAAFTEAFLVGLSDEMGRELLWREYPTDQRGTYFKYFWDDDEEELVAPIHRFFPLPLGQHIVGGSEGRVVFVVRGALVKRYPDAVMFALREVTNPPVGMDAPVFADPNQAGAEARILFHANLSPDILLVGFDLTPQQVVNQKWWFFIAEHPTAPRFGLDVEGTRAPSGSVVDRNDMDWNDVRRTHRSRGSGGFLDPVGSPLTVRELTADPPPQEVGWPPASSAILARVLLQNPIRAAYDGAELLKDM